MSWGVSPCVYPVWDSLGFLDLGDYFLPHFREVFNYYLPKYFVMVFLFVFFFWDSYDSNVWAITVSQWSLRLSSFLFILFSFFLSASFISTILSSISLIFYLLPHLPFYLPPQYLLPLLFYCWFPPECF